METIENEFLKVEVNPFGATLSSVIDKKTGKQLLWQGAENSWKGRDVSIFPVTARFKNLKYTHNGKEYSLKTHGLLRYDELTVTENSGTRLELYYESHKETLEQYPFEFRLTVSYELDGNSLYIKTSVKNVGNETMYFGAGFHPAYNIDCTPHEGYDDITGNTVLFDGEQSLTHYVLDDDGALIVGTKPFRTDRVELSKQAFAEVKTLILGGVRGKITLLTKGGDELIYDMQGAPFVAIWSYYGHGGFVCVEPWWGLPDFADCDSEIANKTGMNALAQGKTFECGYKVVYNIGGNNI